MNKMHLRYNREYFNKTALGIAKTLLQEYEMNPYYNRNPSGINKLLEEAGAEE